MVNKFLYPNGGSETYIFEIGKQLKKMGHEVEVINYMPAINVSKDVAPGVGDGHQQQEAQKQRLVHGPLEEDEPRDDEHCHDSQIDQSGWQHGEFLRLQIFGC